MSLMPRTTAMSALLAGSIFIAVFFSACADKIKPDINVFKALDESLINSNIVIDKQSKTVLASLVDKLADPLTSEKASVWYPKAKLIQKLAADIYIYIEGLRSDLKKEAGLKTKEGIEAFRESDKNAVTRLLDKQGKGEELYERMRNYKHDMLVIDSQIAKTFNNNILLTTESFDTAENKQQDFTKNFFDDIPAIAALAMLSKFENNTKIIENKMINFCNDKTISYGIIDWWLTPLVVQSISHVKPGETIEITAGIGSFIKSSKAEVAINGKKMLVGEEGVAIYKLEVSDKPGKHIIPVEISYLDQDGKKQTATKNIEYTVAN